MTAQRTTSPTQPDPQPDAGRMQVYTRLLKQYWGYDGFRGIQQEIIESIGSGRDTLGLMPTGGGKSITFQVPALAAEGLCLVITPLIALMKDQVDQLKRRGIKAIAVYSGMTAEEIRVAYENVIFGQYKFLYISPERLASELFRTRIKRMHIHLIAVDEAHCISQWGYDFRPAYLSIAQIRDLLPGIPILALTATATPLVVSDICHQLHFRPDAKVCKMSFARPNLIYVVRETDDKEREIGHILRALPGSAIVYTRSRERTRELATRLQQAGITATHYHAGLDDDVKYARQTAWQQGRYRVMVATNAFGMGIDKPDVRLVIHYELPDSPEAYFQEAGRAGRDGHKSYAVLLASGADERSATARLNTLFPPKAYIRRVYEDIQYYYQMAMHDGQGCMYPFDIDDFCTRFKHYPERVKNALLILTRAGYLEFSQEANNRSRIKFILMREELYKLRDAGEKSEKLLQVLLRSYSGMFADYIFVDESLLARKSGLNAQEVYNLLKAFSSRRILHYIPAKRVPTIRYTQRRVEKDKIRLDDAVYADRKKAYAERTRHMLQYVGNHTLCRSKQLLAYFGETDTAACGQCDVCIAQRKDTPHPSQAAIAQIIQLIEHRKACSLDDLCTQLQMSVSDLRPLISYMIDENMIRYQDDTFVPYV